MRLEIVYAPADLRRAPLAFPEEAAALRLKPPRLGEGAAFLRASNSSVACSKVSPSGFIPFGIDAFVVPSVT